MNENAYENLLSIGRKAMQRRTQSAAPICHVVLSKGPHQLWAQVADKLDRENGWMLMARYWLTAVPCDSAALVVERSLFGEDFSSALVTVARDPAAVGAVAASVALLLEQRPEEALLEAPELLSWKRPEAGALAAETLSLPSAESLQALFKPLTYVERIRVEKSLEIDLDFTMLLTLEAFRRPLTEGWIHPAPPRPRIH